MPEKIGKFGLPKGVSARLWTVHHGKLFFSSKLKSSEKVHAKSFVEWCCGPPYSNYKSLLSRFPAEPENIFFFRTRMSLSVTTYYMARSIYSAHDSRTGVTIGGPFFFFAWPFFILVHSALAGWVFGPWWRTAAFCVCTLREKAIFTRNIQLWESYRGLKWTLRRHPLDDFQFGQNVNILVKKWNILIRNLLSDSQCKLDILRIFAFFSFFLLFLVIFHSALAGRVFGPRWRPAPHFTHTRRDKVIFTR